MRYELVWVSPLEHLKARTGVSFAALEGLGVKDAYVHLDVTADTEERFRKAASREGRKGWSSTALCRHLAVQIKKHLAEGRGVVRLNTLRVHVNIPYAMTREISLSLEQDQAAAEKTTEDGKLQAKDIALKMARWLKNDILVAAAETGTDIRWTTMKLVCEQAGAGIGLKNPSFLPSAHFESRTSPSVFSLERSLQLEASCWGLKMAMGDAIEGAQLKCIGVVRVHPRGRTWTGIGVCLELPATSPMFAVWNVDENEVDP